MGNKVDYSKYECPFSHLEKECGHELHGPEGYQDVYSVWCSCNIIRKVIPEFKYKGIEDFIVSPIMLNII